MIHEMYGKVSEQMETERMEHARTVSVLEMLKSGAATLDHLEIVKENGAVRWTLTVPEKVQSE